MTQVVHSLIEAAKLLKEGKIGIIPTDTVWGISGILTEKIAQRINEIKCREIAKPFIVLISNEDMLKNVSAELNKKQIDFIKNNWPNTLTLVLPKNENISEFITAKKSSIAVRYPKESSLSELLKEINQPIISTSANLSGEKETVSLGEIDETLLQAVDFYFETEIVTNNIPSTVVDITNSPYKIIRQGQVEIKL